MCLAALHACRARSYAYSYLARYRQSASSARPVPARDEASDVGSLTLPRNVRMPTAVIIIIIFFATTMDDGSPHSSFIFDKRIKEFLSSN